jgi:methionyl-tRNA synthetase
VETFLVTATPPTPNGDLHVGHLSGPFLAADVFCRFQRMRGGTSVFATGSDDHQTYVLTTAARQAEDPVALADTFAEQIQSTLGAAGIGVDRFARALGDTVHRQTAQAMFQELADAGLLIRKRHPALYCDFCDRPLFEGFVRGWCPRCGEETPGHLCEMCGWVNDPIDLVEPSCSICRQSPKTVEREGLFLPLERHRRSLEDFWASRSGWRPHLTAYCEAMLAHSLPDYPVSYPGDWGIPVPVRGFEQQVINVWLEMYAGHVYAARATASTQDPQTASEFTLVQFLGHDNSFYNAVLHPAVALALGTRWPVPEHLIANEFYFLDDRKFSTSRNHTVSGREALATVGADSLRFYLARSNPERWQANFSQAALIETDRREIRDTWEAAIEQLHQLARQEHPADGAKATSLEVGALLDGARISLERCYGLTAFSLRGASSVLLDLAVAAGDFSHRALASEPGPVAISHSGDAAAFLRYLALLAAPLMPSLSQAAWERSGGRGEVSDQPWPNPA